MFLILLFETAGSAQQRKTPAFEPATCPECPFPKAKAAYLAEHRLSFGYLYVRENRQKKDSRIIRLAVGIIRHGEGGSSDHPLIVVHGGPGGAALEDVSAEMTLISKDRDIILLDQRGCGQSEPACCGNAGTRFMKMLSKDLTPEEEQAEHQSIARECRSELIAAGVDLSAYNSAEIAADINDLGTALGYASWDLWGVSYGTRIALKVMQDYPKRVRRAVLDSPLPPDASYLEESPMNFARALQLLFRKCEEDSACRLAYPHLNNTFLDAVDSLVSHPMIIEMGDTARYQDGRFVLNAQDFQLAVHHALYAHAQYPFLPMVIDAVRRRDAGVVKLFLQSMRNSLLELHYGIYYAVLCNDCFPMNQLQAFDRASVRPSQRLSFYRADFLICREWDAGAHARVRQSSFSSPIPTLVLSGELDPLVPPAYARLARSKLSNGYYRLFENEGHWVTGSLEGAKVMQRFLQDGQLPGLKDQTLDVYKLKFQTK